MTTNPELQALACEDCPAVITETTNPGLGGPVRTVSVEHERTCPWLARVAPDGATLATPWGILMHLFAADAADPSAAS
jgi:hypothetical protein